jgi:hypothetical protein
MLACGGRGDGELRAFKDASQLRGDTYLENLVVRDRPPHRHEIDKHDSVENARPRDIGRVNLDREGNVLEEGEELIIWAEGPSHAPADKLNDEIVAGFPEAEQKTGAAGKAEPDVPRPMPQRRYRAFGRPVRRQDDVK